jgi:tetratricopeptide (TPR) repeat protein
VEVNIKLKNYKHALIASNKVLEFVPNSEKYNKIKVELEKLTLEQAIQVNPTDPQARKDLGNLHYSQGELSKAKIYLESAVSLEPSLKEVWEKLIELDLKIENYKNALIACKKILEIEPKSKKYKKIKSNIEKLLELKDED